MNKTTVIFAVALALLAGTNAGAQGQFRRSKGRDLDDPFQRHFSRDYNPYESIQLPGGLKMDKSGRIVMPSRPEDYTRQPAYPGARFDRMGRPLEAESTTDTLGRHPFPSTRLGHPVRPKHRQGQTDDDERREAVSGMPHVTPHVTPHVPLHWYSGGNSSSSASKDVRKESKAKPAAPSFTGSGSWWGKGGVVGIGSVLAALFGAIFGRKKDQEGSSAPPRRV